MSRSVPYGCYYVTLVLIEYDVGDATWYYTDFSTAENVGSGGALFSFGGADCGGGYDCTDNLENGIICMRDGRFKVRLLWMDFDHVTRPVILKRESDETALGVFQNNQKRCRSRYSAIGTHPYSTCMIRTLSHYLRRMNSYFASEQRNSVTGTVGKPGTGNRCRKMSRSGKSAKHMIAVLSPRVTKNTGFMCLAPFPFPFSFPAGLG